MGKVLNARINGIIWCFEHLLIDLQYLSLEQPILVSIAIARVACTIAVAMKCFPRGGSLHWPCGVFNLSIRPHQERQDRNPAN